jgi:hypothetical protein
MINLAIIPRTRRPITAGLGRDGNRWANLTPLASVLPLESKDRTIVRDCWFWFLIFMAYARQTS